MLYIENVIRGMAAAIDNTFFTNKIDSKRFS